ncbi:MAG: thermonuclease family protein, partial [Litorimonas sp.]
EHREEIKKAGKEATEKLKSMVLGKVIKLECKGFDKYGRLLAEAYYDIDKQSGGTSVSDAMIEGGFAIPYM